MQESRAVGVNRWEEPVTKNPEQVADRSQFVGRPEGPCHLSRLRSKAWQDARPKAGSEGQGGKQNRH